MFVYICTMNYVKVIASAAERVEIIPGLAMPFYPMRPTKGPSLRTADSIKKFWASTGRTQDWVIQPKMNGDRATLALVGGRIYIQNRHGGWYGHSADTTPFLRLPDRTVLDGEVYQGHFHPFEALAINGRSLLRCTVTEREVMACQLTRLVGQQWMFGRPDRRWLLAAQQCSEWDGVVLKRAASCYTILGSDTQMSETWFKRTWKKS